MDYLLKIAASVPKVSSGRLAAAVYFKNQLISVGFNQKKTHPMQARYKSNPERNYLHAEVDAIVKGCRWNKGDLEGCHLYVARSKSNDRQLVPGLAKSCSGCYTCASDFGIKGIYYTTEEGIGYLECN